MTDLPDVKLRALPNFPVRVTGRTATTISKENGQWYVDHDVSELMQNPNISADEVAQSWMTIWNSVTDVYQNVPYALAATSGVSSIDGKTGALDIGNGLAFTGDTLQVAAGDGLVFDSAVLKQVRAATRTALKAIDTTVHSSVFLTEAGREGVFVWRTGDYSAQIALDTEEGVYVKANAVASSSGAWVRANAAFADVAMFGAVQNGSTDDTDAVQGSLDVLGFANILAWRGSSIKIDNVRLKNSGNRLSGVGWPTIIQSAATPIYIEDSFQTVEGFKFTGTATAVTVPTIRLRTSLRGMTTIAIRDLYGTDCGSFLMDDDDGTNRAIFLNIERCTFASHRGYGVLTYDCWASYYLRQVVVDRVGMSGSDYNYPAFYIDGAEGVFFLDCAHNGSAATSIQAQQDGAFFNLCNFVVIKNYIPDHSGGRGLVFNSCINVKVSDSTIVNAVDHGVHVVGGSVFDFSGVTVTQFASGLSSKDGFSLSAVTGFRGVGLYAIGFTRDGFRADASTRLHVQGEFSDCDGRGIVTTGVGVVNLFHGCITANNATGNYSLSSSTDWLRQHIVSAGTIGDADGPATG